MRHSLAKRIICCVLACGMTLTTGMIVYADIDSSVDKEMKSATLVMKITNAPVYSHRHEKFKIIINKLVEERKLTPEKADKIMKYAEEKEQQKDKRFRLIESLQEDGIINNTEAEAIRSKFREMKDQVLTDKLNGMVQKGTINKVQADKIKIYFENARRERIEKLKNMNEEQRKEYFKERKQGQPIIDKLVNDGIITKEQAKELRMVLKEGPKH